MPKNPTSRAKLRLPLLLIILFIFNYWCSGQSRIKNFLVAGKQSAEEITAQFISPIAEGMMYAATGGWYQSAVVERPWTFDFSVISNGSFVPNEKKSFILDSRDHPNLNFLDGSIRAQLPTIVGNDRNLVKLVANFQGQEYIFDAPGAINLLSDNIMPTVFLQGKVALPLYTEFSVRYFPKIYWDRNSRVGLYGFGGKHEFSRWIKAMQDQKFAFAAMLAFTQLNADYDLQSDELVKGSGQKFDEKLYTWLIELVSSTHFPIFNVYSGVGYVWGRSNTRMLGNYELGDPTALILTDPFAIQNRVSGLRANIGISLGYKWIKGFVDYTFQGYNNLSAGLTVSIFPKKK